MKTTYFKTEKAFYQSVMDTKGAGFTVDVCAMSCACGESNGMLIYKNEKIGEKAILCESCHNSASYQERGE